MGITGSIVLAADDPAALASFYGALLEFEPQPGLSATHWRVPWFVVGWRSTRHRAAVPSRSSGDFRTPFFRSFHSSRGTIG